MWHEVGQFRGLMQSCRLRAYLDRSFVGCIVVEVPEGALCGLMALGGQGSFKGAGIGGLYEDYSRLSWKYSGI